MSLSPNTTLAHYSVISKIGAGGMGEVYRARDTKLGRDVAIKVLPASLSENADRLNRFEREAQAAGALNHPNILVIHHIGLHNGAPFIVSELLEGETLRERLAGGALPQRKAIDYALQIAKGLAAAHEKGIVHRDIKPDNIFITDDGRVKILDFGLAKLTAVDGIESQTDVPTRKVNTDPGTVMGTMGYMSPEQLKEKQVDHRSDIFSFGAILYEMLSGKRAFRGDSMAETMSAILREDPPELSETNKTVSPALERIVRHCMEKNPAERFRSASDLAFALESLSAPTSSSGNNLTASTNSMAGEHRSVWRGRIPWIVTTSLLTLAIIGFVSWYFGLGKAAKPSASVTEVTYKQVTFEEGFIFTARFASDGRTIVYSADWNQKPLGVYVTSLDNLEYRSLGFPGADLLAISRSGELGILSKSTVTGGEPYWRTGTLARASLTGGAPRPELEGVNFADFGPGNTWAVVRDDGGRRKVEYPVGQVLAEVPIVKTGSLTAGNGQFATPRVSPFGDYIAFFDVRVPAAFKVKIFDRSGKFVTESKPFSDWWALAWTASNEVWFAATEESGRQTAIYSLDLSGRQRMVFRAPGAITLHDISTQGDVLVSFDRVKNRIEIIDGSNPAPQERSWREDGFLGGFSNSHTLLINNQGDSGGPKGSVSVWQPNEAQPIRIGNGLGLALAPDGSKALIASSQAPLKLTIVPTGAGQPQVVDAGPVESVSWAGWLPDGRLVIQTVRPGSGPAVNVLSAAGRDPVVLLPAGVTLSGNNLLSPDGSRVIALDTNGQLMMCMIATPSCRPIPGTRDGDVVSGWTADGQAIFVYQPQPMHVQIDRLEVSSGRRSLLKTVHPLNVAVSGLYNVTVSPDGAVAYGYRADASQLYVIRGLR